MIQTTAQRAARTTTVCPRDRRQFLIGRYAWRSASVRGVKTFLTLSLAGLLVAGFAVGTFVEGTDDPKRQGLLLGFGLWLTLVGYVLRDDAP